MSTIPTNYPGNGKMIFKETIISGAFIVQPIPIYDSRGFFSRSFCAKEFEECGLRPVVAQCNISFNLLKGTLRGIHFRIAPGKEAKLVRCTRGAIYDVVVDLRPDSPTYKSWFGIELNSENRLGLYIPERCGHGFQTLDENTEVFYQMSEFYEPELERGICYNDPSIAIEWPLPVSVISERDKALPLLRGE